jgi:outer membrane protein assembly factor BamB
MITNRPLPCVAAILLVASTAQAADWPAWRGADRTNISKETGLAAKWPEGGPKLLWKSTGLGEGFSTPAVSGGALLTMGNRDGQEYVIALETKSSGKLIWGTPLGPVRHGGGGYPGPRSTPTIELGKVYALGLNGDLVALDLKTGRILWRHNLVADFGGEVPNWGYSESPLVDGPWVLATPGGARATIVALLKTTGKPVWGASVGDGAAYSSIIKAEIGRVKQYVQMTDKGVIGVDAKNGTPLWRYDAPANGTANIPTPLASGDVVFAASGYGTGGGAVKVTKKGSNFSADEVFFTKEMINHHGGIVLIDGHLYGACDPDRLTCIELATGTTKWQERRYGKCSMTAVGNQLITRDERGKVRLVNVSPAGMEIVGEFDQPDQSDKPTWPHPVVSDGRLYLRDQDAIFCYDLK